MKIKNSKKSILKYSVNFKLKNSIYIVNNIEQNEDEIHTGTINLYSEYKDGQMFVKCDMETQIEVIGNIIPATRNHPEETEETIKMIDCSLSEIAMKYYIAYNSGAPIEAEEDVIFIYDCRNNILIYEGE
jgi:hypothetical protein